MPSSGTVSIPTLETPRLYLRPLCGADFQSYAALCADEQVMRWVGDCSVLDAGQAWRQLAMLLGHWDLRGFGMWAVERREDGVFLGRAGLHYPEGWPGIEAGWVFARAFWGQGYASEAGARIVDYAREHLDADSLVSLIHPENAASIRVASKLGGKLAGILTGPPRAVMLRIPLRETQC
ncbi:MAG: GNAT family N-acetyltransferase [Gammaproteobacteria bacterium]